MVEVIKPGARLGNTAKPEGIADIPRWTRFLQHDGETHREIIGVGVGAFPDCLADSVPVAVICEQARCGSCGHCRETVCRIILEGNRRAGFRFSLGDSVSICIVRECRDSGRQQAIVRVVPGMIVFVRWLPAESLGMRIHSGEMESARVSASGTGAGDLPVSDAVRGGSLAGRPITLMG